MKSNFLRTKGAGATSVETMIEHLQEMNKVAITEDIDITLVQEYLKKQGYETVFESTDRDYLVLVNR